MSDILIKGMEMPKGCSWYTEDKHFYECFLHKSCEKYISYHELADELDYPQTIKSADCPLVDVPPHGRLVDAEKLKVVLYKWEESARCGGHYEFADAYKTVREIIDDRDCVVEASE